jgi:hypothetical protein
MTDARERWAREIFDQELDRRYDSPVSISRHTEAAVAAILAAADAERAALVIWIEASVEDRWHSQNPDKAYRDAYETGIADACMWLVEDIEQSAHLPGEGDCVDAP